ncbi:hypothetical protein [Dyella sp. ASV21]|nr:hypothetical protein [Dyella sp. ASV21]
MEQITYLGYCALGGARNPRLMSKAVYLGKHFHHWTYWLRTA